MRKVKGARVARRCVTGFFINGNDRASLAVYGRESSRKETSRFVFRRRDTTRAPKSRRGERKDVSAMHRIREITSPLAVCVSDKV